MIKVIKEIKKLNAERLVSIAFVEEDKGYRIYYHFSDDSKGRIKEFSIKAKKKDKIESLTSLYTNALIFEAEITEFTGLKFIGNELSGVRLFKAERKKHA